MKDDARARLERASEAVVAAVAILKTGQPTFEAFLKECHDMDDFGYVVNPTLANDPERRAVTALMEPIFRAAVDFVRLYDAQTTKAREVLRKVG